MRYSLRAPQDVRLPIVEVQQVDLCINISIPMRLVSVIYMQTFDTLEVKSHPIFIQNNTTLHISTKNI